MKQIEQTMPGLGGRSAAAVGFERTVAAVPAEGMAATLAPDVVVSEAMLPKGTVLGAASNGFERGDSIGPFLVLSLLGAGGMGAVFAAYDPQLDRQVAIKIVHPGLSESETIGAVKSRLLREAQAMAKLSHPNVITVYEVGALGDDIYVAMELVDGGTLSGWLAQARADQLPWQVIVAKVVEAGRGLAAAHHAGLVHRDFKPDNVLVGTAGTVRVTDFGLVGSTDAEDEPAVMAAVSLQMPRASTRALPQTLPEVARATAIAASVERSITRTGAVMGTPAYMAPEQHLGKRAGERADQFAFCVTLYEALTGDRPFAGETYGELMANTCSGRVRPFAKSSRIPAWIRAAILRGLSIDPDARFASMAELLAILEAAPGRKQRRIAAIAGATLALGGAFALALGSRGAAETMPPCQSSRARLAGVWDDSVKATVHRAFVTAGDRGDVSFDRVATALDGYTQRWTAGHTDACEAAVVRHEQSDLVLDLRNRCLERRRLELSSLVALLANADRETMTKAPQAAYTLVAPEGCSDVEILGAAFPPPEQPDVAAKVTELRTRLAVALARQATGKWRDGLVLADAALADARTIDYPPVLAEALFLDGTLRRDLKDGRGAEDKLLELTIVAAKAKDDVLLARTWPELVFVVGFLEGKPAEGLAFERPGRSMLERIGGGEPRVRARLENTVGLAHTKAGRRAEARQHQERALALQQTALGLAHPDVGMSLNNLALIAKDDGRFAEALAYYDRAIVIRERAFGPEHPYLATLLQGRATVSPVMESIKLNDRVLAMQERVLGPTAQEVAVTLSNQAGNYGTIGNYQRQLELAERALPIKLAASGPDNPSTGYTQYAIGQALAELGRCEQAVPHLRRTIEIFEQAGANQSMVVRAEWSWASCEISAHRFAEARAHVAHAVAVGETIGKSSSELAEALSARASLAVAEHRRSDALRDYEHVLAIREAAAPDAIDVATALEAIARIRIARDEIAAAIPILERALAIEKAVGSPNGVAWCTAQLAKYRRSRSI